MIDRVQETLQRWRQTPFAWNGEDCLMSLADYLRPIMGFDFGAPFRGRYNSEWEAYRLIDEAGGPLAVLDRTGLVRVATPARGDLVLLGLEHPTGAICTHGRAYEDVTIHPPALPRGVFYGAARRPKGVAEVDLSFIRILGIWSVPKCLPLPR